MKLKFAVFAFIFLLNTNLKSFAQNASQGFNWCEDKKRTQGAWTYLSDQCEMKTVAAYSVARAPLQDLIAYCPKVNKGLYVYGKRVYTELADDLAKTNPKDPKLPIWQDSALYMMDKYTELFPEEEQAVWFNQKGNYLYRYKVERTKTNDEWTAIYKQYVKIHELNGQEIYPYNANVLMGLMCQQKSMGNLSDADIIKYYEKLNGYYKYHTENSTKLTASWKTYKKFVDEAFGNCVKYDCKLVKNILEPKYRETKDFGLAKEMWAIMRDDKCTDDALFKELTQLIAEKEPSVALLKYTASTLYKDDKIDQAISYYEKAIEMSTDNKEKGELMMIVAGIYQNQGNRNSARSWYRKAGAQGEREAYERIGDMYYASYKECTKGDPVGDRIIFIAAYEMFQQGGAGSKAEKAKEQFPSKTDIFSYPQYKEGQSVNTGCWVNENVTLRPR